MAAFSKWALDRTIHGGYLGGKENPEHYTWRTMIARCTNPNQASYRYYGARGIKVCERWLVYKNFLSDMGLKPSPEYSLERINTNEDYKPSNCKWATRSEQQKNKSTTKWYTNDEFTGTLVECAKHLGISKALALWRWKQWGTFEKGVVWQQRQKVV